MGLASRGSPAGRAAGTHVPACSLFSSVKLQCFITRTQQPVRHLSRAASTAPDAPPGNTQTDEYESEYESYTEEAPEPSKFPFSLWTRGKPSAGQETAPAAPTDDALLPAHPHPKAAARSQAGAVHERADIAAGAAGGAAEQLAATAGAGEAAPPAAVRIAGDSGAPLPRAHAHARHHVYTVATTPAAWPSAQPLWEGGASLGGLLLAATVLLATRESRLQA